MVCNSSKGSLGTHEEGGGGAQGARASQTETLLWAPLWKIRDPRQGPSSQMPSPCVLGEGVSVGSLDKDTNSILEF